MHRLASLALACLCACASNGPGELPTNQADSGVPRTRSLGGSIDGLTPGEQDAGGSSDAGAVDPIGGDAGDSTRERDAGADAGADVETSRDAEPDPCGDDDGDGSCAADDPCPDDFCDRCNSGGIPPRCDDLLWELSFEKYGLDLPEVDPVYALLGAKGSGGDVRHRVELAADWSGEASSDLPPEFSEALWPDSDEDARWLERAMLTGTTASGPADGALEPSPLRPGDYAVRAVVAGSIDLLGARGYSITMQLRGYSAPVDR